MRRSLEAVVIADDLTGAADTGVQFSSIGSRVFLMPVESLTQERPWMDSAAGIAVYTDTRHRPAKEAAERLRCLARILPGLHPRFVYKKIDSCLRGNPGAEIDALLDATGLDAALVAPAFPSMGRTTVHGIHRVHGIPLADTEFAKDPVAPVTCSGVVDILASQSRHDVGRIDLDEYADLRRLRRAVRRERNGGCRLIVCDAATREHLDQVASLVAAGAGRLLPVGSAGLAASLVGRVACGGSPEHPGIHRIIRLLIVCGSGSPVTRRQVDALLDRHPVVRLELEPEWLAKSSLAGIRRRATELLDAWMTGVLALQIRPLPPGGPAVNPGRTIAGLAALALEIVRADGVDGIFLSGGETAEAFRVATGGEAIELEQEMVPGLVLGRWKGGAADGLPVITKAGAFGDEQVLIELYERFCGGSTA